MAKKGQPLRKGGRQKPPAPEKTVPQKSPTRKSGQAKSPQAVVRFSPKTSGNGRSAEDADFPIVAIGASAGGLEAFRSLIGALPSNTRFSFVIIQHLSPTHESMLPDILSKTTALPVIEAKDNMELLAGSIYVMPPTANLTLEQGRLRLHPREGQGRNMPVDVFFRSLAEDQPHRAIAVILSGAGTDGSLGMQEVKAAGGITFAQDEKSARFHSMPFSAVSNRADNFVLFPERIAEELVRICTTLRQRPALLNLEQTGQTKELDAAKDYLRSIIEEQEATNEELKSANEEILSSNEELQIINEELQNRNQELNQLNNDMNNLLSSVNVPIVILGNDLRIRRFTPMAEKVLKLIPTDVGRPLSDIQTSLSLANLDCITVEVIDTMSVREMEVRDHSGHWYSLRIRPYLTGDNKIDGAVLTFIDIDSLKASLARLQAATDYAESIVETVSAPLLVVDTDWRIRSANRAYQEALPAGHADVKGHSILELGYGGTPIPGLVHILAEIRSGGPELRNRELILHRPSGPLTLVLNARPLPAEKDKSSHLLLSMEDITARKQVEREVRRLNQELELRVQELVSANARLESEVADRQRAEENLQHTVGELESFSYSVSHDLRAPLRAMQGVAEALLEDYGDKLDTTGQDYARRIVTAAHRMDTLIHDLLVYSRLGQGDRDFQPCDLTEAVEEALGQLDKVIRDSGAEVTVRKPLGRVLAHGLLLETLVLNLISNALKFMAPGVKPVVRIRSESLGGMVRLWVKDNGIGIDPEHHKRIFRVFERLHGIEKYPGTGIGLAMVRKGVEAFGGKAGVESSPGAGSRFWVELPAAESGAEA